MRRAHPFPIADERHRALAGEQHLRAGGFEGAAVGLQAVAQRVEAVAEVGEVGRVARQRGRVAPQRFIEAVVRRALIEQPGDGRALPPGRVGRRNPRRIPW